jgi:hypothetical protein
LEKFDGSGDLVVFEVYKPEGAGPISDDNSAVHGIVPDIVSIIPERKAPCRRERFPIECAYASIASICNDDLIEFRNVHDTLRFR